MMLGGSPDPVRDDRTRHRSDAAAARVLSEARPLCGPSIEETDTQWLDLARPSVGPRRSGSQVRYRQVLQVVRPGCRPGAAQGGHDDLHQIIVTLACTRPAAQHARGTRPSRALAVPRTHDINKPTITTPERWPCRELTASTSRP